MEGYVFAAIIFWIICYAMSKYSYNLEQKYKNRTIKIMSDNIIQINNMNKWFGDFQV
jgi:predicted membrane protein